jgi:DNA helicase II / ATP-dependent DNA helicase PcrA
MGPHQICVLLGKFKFASASASTWRSSLRSMDFPHFGQTSESPVGIGCVPGGNGPVPSRKFQTAPHWHFRTKLRTLVALTNLNCDGLDELPADKPIFTSPPTRNAAPSAFALFSPPANFCYNGLGVSSMAPVPNSSNSSATVFPLNPEQRAAVEHGDGPLLVVAGAGTGKTRVITERIRYLLESNPSLAGESILGLTFTDKAAAEMKYRVVDAVGERAESVWLSTFHSFCLEKILRTANAGIQPLDELDHKILLRRHIGRLQLKHFKRLQEPSEFLEDFVKFFSRCQDELVTPDDYRLYVGSLRRRFEARRNFFEPDERAVALDEVEKQEELARAFCVSEELLRERNLTTFGAQLLDAVTLLRTGADLLTQLRNQYRYILVDEFQDTNIAQLELLWLLAGDRRNIMAVGDHNQAIYRFRGASYGSFTIFLKRFCGVREAKLGPSSRRFLATLSQNYRSTKRILNVAYAVIRNNEQSPLLPQEPLSTENREGEKIRVVEFADVLEEAHWVASEIDRLHGAGAPWHSMAVLYRKHTHRDLLVGALQARGIPFVIRRFSILSSTLVRDLLAWLRLIGQPGDNVACARVLAAPYWGLDPRDLVRLAERAERNHRSPISSELDTAQKELPFAGEGKRLPELVAVLNRLRQGARRKTVSELLDELIAALELAPLPSEADRYYLDRFVAFVREWERKMLAEPEPQANPEFVLANPEPRKGKQLRDFLEYLYYFNEARGDVFLEDQRSEDAVELMTVHSAKGLEFPHVFILRLSKRDFPSPARRPVFEFPPELMKEEKPEGDFHIQEERRLFYVALTRARRRLTLSTIVNKMKRQSPFLEDFLEDPNVKTHDTQQLAPQIALPTLAETAAPAPNPVNQGSLFTGLREGSRAYSRVALWAKAFHPPKPEPLQLSASAISAYEHCPMKYMFQHLWSIRGGPHAQATFGSVMHTVIKAFVGEMRRRRRVSLEDVLTIYDREWSSAGFPDSYHETEYRNAGREQLEAFHRTCVESPADVLHQEKSFQLPLAHEIVVIGRIDQVNRIGRRQYEIVDYKTGRPRDAKKAGEDLQLSVYALAAREVLEIEPTRLVFYNLMTNEAVATTRDEKALAETKQRIAIVADQIRAGEFSPTPNFGCANCDYKPLCPAHEQLVSIRPNPRG